MTALRAEAMGAVALAILLVGCEARDPDRIGAPGAQVSGHVYLAQIIPLHPMYPDLAKVAEAVRPLRQPEEPLELPQFALGGSIGGARFAGPVLLNWPGDVWEARRDLARGGLQGSPPDTFGELPPDVRARLHARVLQAQKAEGAALLKARSETGDALAKQTAQLYRDNLERLSGGSEGEKREDVEAELERRVAELRETQQEHLAQTEAAEAAKRNDRIKAATEDAERVSSGRRTPPAEGGARLREQMLESLEAFEVPDWVTQAAVEVPQVELPAEGDRGAGFEQERQEAREAAARVLVRREAEITDGLLGAARLAVEKVGRERGLRVVCVPEGEPVGRDLTAEVAEEVGRLWGTGGVASAGR